MDTAVTEAESTCLGVRDIGERILKQDDDDFVHERTVDWIANWTGATNELAGEYDWNASDVNGGRFQIFLLVNRQL